MARISLEPPENPPDDYSELITASHGELNILKARANNTTITRSVMKYLQTLLDDGGLDPRERELIILTIANTLSSRYIWHQHVHLARERGVTISEMNSIGNCELNPFAESEQILMRFAEAIAKDQVTDKLFQAVATNYDCSKLITILTLSCYYIGNAYAISALDLPIESSFVGWNNIDVET